MATSQNGYRANDRSLIASYSVPGGKIAMRKGDVATVLSYVANRFHSEVEPLVWPGNWGYAERTIRGNSTTLSNHASGTAIDLNAPRHPLGKVGTFSSAQRGRIQKILRDCGGVVRWGGNYNGRKDEMHFEINAGTAAVAKVAKAIRAGKKPGPSGGATSSGRSGGSSTSYSAVKYGNILKLYTRGEPVKEWQIVALGYSGSKADGYFGPSTAADTKKVQKKYGVTADGIVGPKTWPLRLKENKGKYERAKPTPSKSDPFPLPKGHFYYTEDSRSTVHSGYWSKDRPAIRKIQKKVGTGVDGGYGAKTRAAVIRWQKKNGLKADGAVGVSTWNKMF